MSCVLPVCVRRVWWILALCHVVIALFYLPAATALPACLNRGDVNRDLRVTPNDARMVLQHYLGRRDIPECPRAETQITPADVSCVFQVFLGQSACLDDTGGSVPNIAIAPAPTHAFGLVRVGASSDAVFTVSNTGTATLTLQNLIIAGPNATAFQLQTTNCDGVSLAPTGSCTATVRFTPGEATAQQASLTVPSNDPDTPQLVVTLTGTGTLTSPRILIPQPCTCRGAVGDDVEVSVQVSEEGLTVQRFTAEGLSRQVGAQGAGTPDEPVPVTFTLNLGDGVFVDAEGREVGTEVTILTNAAGLASTRVRLGRERVHIVEASAPDAEPVRFEIIGFVNIVAIAAENDDSLVVVDTTLRALLRIVPGVDLMPASSQQFLLSGRDQDPNDQRNDGPPFATPVDVAIDRSTQALFVVDAALDSIVQVDPETGNRTLVSACAERNPDGRGEGPCLETPLDVAVDQTTGSLVVTNLTGDVWRVQTDTGARHLISPAPRSAETGAQESFLEDIGVEADGQLVVADSRRNAILRIDPDTGSRSTISGCNAADSAFQRGTGPCFGFLRSLTVDPTDGFLIVATDQNVLRIHPGTGDRQEVVRRTAFPNGIARRSDGALVMADGLFLAVTYVDPDRGDFRIISQPPTIGSGLPFLSQITALTVERTDALVVIDVIDTDDGRATSLITEVDATTGSRALLTALDGRARAVVETATNQLVVAVASNVSSGLLTHLDLTTSTLAFPEAVPLSGCAGRIDAGVCSGGAVFGTGPLFSDPLALLVEARGNLLVADSQGRIVRVNANTGDREVLSDALQAIGSGPGLQRPSAMAFDLTNNLVVVDSLLRTVVAVNLNTGERRIVSGCTEFVGTTCIGASRGTGRGFSNPVGLAVAKATGTLFVTDRSLEAVVRVDPSTGNRTVLSGCDDFIRTTRDLFCTGKLQGPGEPFLAPGGVALERSGTLALADSALRAVVQVQPDNGERRIISRGLFDLGPIVVRPREQNSRAGDTIGLRILASHLERNVTLTYSAEGLPPGLRIEATSGVITGTIATMAATGSPYTVTLTVADGTTSRSEMLRWIVRSRGANRAPMVTNPGDQVSTTGDVISLVVPALDLDAETLTYSATGLPPGLGIDSGTGRVGGMVAETAPTGSPYTVTVTVSDGTTSSTVVFTWSVHAPPDDDHGNTPATADSVAFNTDTVGSIETTGDVDGFRFTLATAGIVIITTAGDTDTFGTLVDDAGTVIADDDDSGEGPNFRIEVALPAGIYTVLVRGFASTVLGAYTLRVESSDDHGNVSATATPVGFNTAIAGNLEVGGDVDVLRFDLAAAGTVTLATTGTTDTFGTLLDDSGGILATDDDSGDGVNFQIEKNLSPGRYFIAIQGFRDTITGAYSLTITPGGGGDDHGNTAATATALSFNTPTAGNLEQVGDIDVFRFELPAAGPVTLASTGGTDMVGILLSASGTLLATDDDSGEGVNFQIETALPAGNYILIVRGFSDAVSGAYTLTLTSTARLDDHGNTLPTATLVALNTPISGELEEGGDIDVFRFELPSPGFVTVTTTGSTDTFGTWVNAAGAVLAEDDDNGTETNFQIDLFLPAGTYFIAVSGFDEFVSGAYSLTVSAAFSNDDHGGTLAAATPITLNTATGGELEVGGDVDVFRFDLPVAGSIMLATTGATDTFGALLNDQGTILASDDDRGEGRNFQIDIDLPAGVYFIAVEGFLGLVTGPYTVTVSRRDDHGNTLPTATAVALHVPTNGRLEVGGDIDVFRFDLPVAVPVTLTTSSLLDTFGTLLDSTGVILARDDDSGANANFEIVADLPAGTYFVAVEGFSTAVTGSYTVTVAPQDDHGNTITTATAVPLDAPIAGNLEVGGDIDVLRFTLPVAGSVTLSTSGGLDTFGTLLDAAGTVLVTDDDNGEAGNFEIVADLPASTYFIAVQGFDNDQIGVYTLNIASSAIPVSVNTATAGTITFDSDVTIFRFDLPAADTVSVATHSDLDTVGTLLDTTGTIRAEGDDNGDERNFHITTPLPAGTYFIAVRGFNRLDVGPYTLTVAALGTATPVALNTASPARIDAEGAAQVFRFDLPVASTVTLRTTGSLDTFGTLVDATGAFVRADDDSGEGVNFQIAMNLPAGTYGVIVRGFDASQIGDYTLFVDGGP